MNTVFSTHPSSCPTEDNIIDARSHFPKKTKTPPTTPPLILQHGAVDPIRDKEDIEAAKRYFLSQPARFTNNPINIRNYAYFVFAINCGRRVSDLIRFKIKDVFNPNTSTIYPFVYIREKKNKHSMKLPLSPQAQDALLLYITSFPHIDPDHYLFKSRQGENNHITRVQAYRILKDMADNTGLTEKGVSVGCHSTRKTAAYHMLKNNVPCEVVANFLGHKDLRSLLNYAGVSNDDIYNAVMANGL